MINTHDEITRLANRRADALPALLTVPERLKPLLDILPNCPYHLINRIGSIFADLRPARAENKPRQSDLDLTIPAIFCNDELWQILLTEDHDGELIAWGDNDALVATSNTFFFVNPKYQVLSNNEKQGLVCKLFQDQIVNPEDSQLHTISTGESIIYVAPNIGNVDDPKQNYPEPYAEVYPFILGMDRPEENAYMDLGYLPDQGRAVISTSGAVYPLHVSYHHDQEFQPNLNNYAALSPNHAIMFLRRLVKSTISTLRHSTSKSLKEDRIATFWKYNQLVRDTLISPFALDDNAKSSMASLDKKIKKLNKLSQPQNS